MSEAFAIEGRPAKTLGLRHVLRLDAATCLLMGMLLVSAAEPLSGWLGLPQGLLFWAGAALLPCALLMIIAAATSGPSSVLVPLVIIGNAVWIAASIAVTVVLEPTRLGTGFVLGQACVVLVLLVLEWRGRAG